MRKFASFVIKPMRTFSLWAPCFYLMSCSHLPVQEFPSTANPSEEIDRVEAGINEARDKQVNVLSPTYFREANEKLSEAKKERSDGKDNKTILESVAESRANLDKANEVARVGRVSMDEVIKARSDALAVEADKYSREAFKNADQEMKEMAEDIEKNDLKAAEKGRGKLKDTYSALELKAIKDANLAGARETVAAAVKEGADRNAKRTLDAAQKSIAEADAFITDNRYDKAGIEARSAAARANADRLLKITRDVKVAGNKDSEAIILEMEAEQKAAAEKAEALAKTEAELGKQQDTVATLENEREFNQRLDSIRAQFSEQEAEVFREGQQVLIRLKGLNFPAGKAVITTASYPLLGKVEQAVKDLGNGTVTIQGHTDATGSKNKNLKLSAARAEAVKAYLVANANLPDNSIVATGMGDQKPLASNKTSAGRAENRRVDVIIEPNRAALAH